MKVVGVWVGVVGRKEVETGKWKGGWKVFGWKMVGWVVGMWLEAALTVVGGWLEGG